MLSTKIFKMKIQIHHQIYQNPNQSSFEALEIWLCMCGIELRFYFVFFQRNLSQEHVST